MIFAFNQPKTMFDSFREILLRLTGYDWIAIITTIVLFETLLEKTFKIDFFGRKIFRFIWLVFVFFLNWFLMPFKGIFNEKLKEAKEKLLLSPNNLETKLVEVFARDQTQFEKLEAIQSSVEQIKHEVSFNDGSSLKDAVHSLKDDHGKLSKVLEVLTLAAELAALRLEIADEQSERLTLHFTPDLKCDYACETYLKRFGWQMSDMIGFNWENTVADESIENCLKKWQRARENRSRFYNEQFNLDADGNKYLCLVRGYPVIDGFFLTVELLDGETKEILTAEETGEQFWIDRQLLPQKPERKK